MPRMRIALLLAAFCLTAHAAEEAAVLPSADLTLDIVKLDPPDGSTLKAGDSVKATIEWHYAKAGKTVQVWLKPELTENIDASYDMDHGEISHRGAGVLDRTVTVSEPGHVASLLLVAKDLDLNEIYRRRVKVAYTWVANSTQEALRKDGLDSRITGVTFDPPSPARLASGAPVFVHIGYDAKSTKGIRPTAMAVTSCQMNWGGAEQSVAGRGTFDQIFIVKGPCAVHQVQVQLLNAGDAVVDEKLVDVDLTYER